ncbi:MAG: transglutaminase domain-containing protein [Aeromonas sp.]
MGVITWGWISLAFWVLVAGMAFADTQAIQAVHSQVNERITYRYATTAENKRIPAGEQGEGNCYVYAYNYFKDLRERGVTARIAWCRLPDGQGHAFTIAERKWVLDNRYQHPIPLSQQDCEAL